MKKIIAIILLLPALCQAQHETGYRGISRSAADARYVLRNPYYDGSQSVTVASASIVGVGGLNIVYPANNSSAIHIGTGAVGGVYIDGTTPANGGVRFGASLMGGANVAQSTTPASLIAVDGELRFRTDSGATVGASYTPTSRLTISNAGVVSVPGSSFSVGTSTLVVTGGKVGVGATPGITELLRVRNDASSANYAITIEEASGGETWQMGVTSDGDFRFGDSGGTTGLITFQDGTGNVGIGTTAPQTTLHVSSNSSVAGTIVTAAYVVNNLSTSNSGSRLVLGSSSAPELRANGTVGLASTRDSSTAGGSFIIETAPGGDVQASERVRVRYDGNVGIGTTSPNYAKTIIKGATTQLILSNSATDENSYSELMFHNTTAEYSGEDAFITGKIRGIRSNSGTNGALAFHTQTSAGVTSEKMRITSAGNVGIGTTAPDTKLHISSGEFKSDGNLSVATGWIIGGSRGVYLTNRSGTTISSGTVLTYENLSGFSLSFTTAAANSSVPIGTLYDASCAAGAVCRVCMEGVCPADLVSDEACAVGTDVYVIVGDQDGKAQCVTAPDAPTHNREIGQPGSFTAVNGDVISVYAHRN